MGHLFQRRVLLGVCGGIAAYKSAELVRSLQNHGAQVRVIMTRGAQEFITPLTLQALSGHGVHDSLLDEEAEKGMGHIELARWADLLLIAPATADCMARLVAGRADDLLSAVALATEAPILIAPAMNQQMWANTATQANLQTLEKRKINIAGPASGDQACGEVGPGRMLEPPQIAEQAASLFSSRILDGKRVLLTAGPTLEPLDPVRYLSYHSSGRMGYALARAALEAGAAVDLVTGPTNLTPPDRATVHAVSTAQEMLDACLSLKASCDIFIACAAVADYRPSAVSEQKIKKSGEQTELMLAPNPDIVATITASEPKPFTVGFAAETEKLREYAQGKRQRKRMDMIVANDVSNPAIGFNSDCNAALMLWEGGELELAHSTKETMAARIMAQVAELL